MIISVDDNRKYNGFLNQIREAICPRCDQKKFRQEIKNLDPNFPVDEESGSKISMRDISQEDFDAHTSFVKTMCIRQGIRLDWFTETDIFDAREAKFIADASDDFEEDDEGRITTGVICSNCGCQTIRQLTEERYDELKSIASGDREERTDPLSESFYCLNCIVLKSKEESNER